MTEQDPGKAPYTGHVEPGGAAATRTVPGVTITKVSVGPMDNDCYVLECAATGEQLLIDAANDAERLLPLVPRLTTIVTTHQHADHWQALAAVAAATGARTLAHTLDAGPLPVKPDLLLEDGDSVTFGQHELAVRNIRGHTPGSVSLLLRPETGDPHLFTGDCLFPGGPGNTQQDAKRFIRLMDDLEERIFAVLPDGTWVYPGHGDDTTLGAERPHLAEWRARGW
ncbi:MAG TPA: MBL fold metallo-hydrolase [Mycobacteriales bacterium]|nr:MBL fold metallo-hydrolase [Mycobacteriales bacterium]